MEEQHGRPEGPLLAQAKGAAVNVAAVGGATTRTAHGPANRRYGGTGPRAGAAGTARLVTAVVPDT
jgi:hypothetical protein